MESSWTRRPIKKSSEQDGSRSEEEKFIETPVMAQSSGPVVVTISAPPVRRPAAPLPTSPNSAYSVNPQMQATAESVPWWIPTDADTSETYEQWYASSAPPAQILTKKSKSKAVKRKIEPIDPAQDAEKVACAQRELSTLMKPLKCDLCNAVMNSTLQAKLHYEGKPHQKKVSMFLNQSVKKLKIESGDASSTTDNDWQNYCDICKTWFTSETDAQQHYAGKKHLRAAHGGPRPKSSKKSQNPFDQQLDPSGRYGIGMAFTPEVPPVPDTHTLVEPAMLSLSAPVAGSAGAPVDTPMTYAMSLKCELCGISTNRHDQLETHKRGAKHLKMLKLKGLQMTETVAADEIVRASIDYSKYRTPSGQYYCAPCNIALSSEASFARHMESKKHKQKINPPPILPDSSNKKVQSKKKKIADR
ncbi:zinc finger matrin-type protein 3-like isoform X2 [Prorops nasuta]